MTRPARWLLPSLALALAALLLWLAFAWQPASAPHDPFETRAEAPVGGDFTLDSPDGPVALSAYRGKVVVLYFGYTFCPDVCPTSLSALAQALSALTPEELARVRSFLISVDPERDTMEVLKAYAPFFHPSLVGLRGTTLQVAAVARQYGARYMKQKPDDDGRYSVDHSSFLYVIAADGKLAARLPYGSPPQAIVEALRAQLDRPR